MLRFNTFRPDRYLRTKFVEGKFLLASEASDLELEILDLMRTMTKDAIGDVAIEDAWKVERISATQLLIKPGEAWFKGLPFINRFGKDELVTGAILSLGIAPAGVVASDDTLGGGKILTFNSGSTTPSNTYRLVVSASEELITDVQDPFLKNINLTEDTAQKIRLHFRINIVPESLQTDTPIPYRDENSASGSVTNFPTTGAFASPNLQNQIVVTPTLGGNGELLATNIVTGSQGIDGRSVELTVRNDPGLGGGNPFPNGSVAQQAFANCFLIDSNGSVFYVNAIFNDTISTQLIIRVDQEVTQPVPEIVNTRPYTLIKRDVYVTDDVNGTPQGLLWWPIADVVWDSSNQFVHSSVVTDLRNVVEEELLYQNLINDRNTLNTVDGGLFSLAADGMTLSWASDIHVVGPSTQTQTISSGSGFLVPGGFLVYELDLDTAGDLRKGTLAVTTTTTGTSISLSGSPSLVSVSKGNILVVGAQFAEIIAIDDVNKVLTLATSITVSGSGTIYLDSYASASYLTDENTYVLAVQAGTLVWIAGKLALKAGQTGSLNFSQPELTPNRVVVTDPSGFLTDTTSNDVTLSANSLALKKVAYTSTTDSSTTGSDATLASFNAGVVRLTNGSLVSVGGIPAGLPGQILLIENKTGNVLLINNEDSGTSAANRILTGTNASAAMLNNATFSFVYDSTSSRWQMSSGGGSGAGTVIELVGGGILSYNNGSGSPVTYSTTGGTPQNGITDSSVIPTHHNFGQTLTPTLSGTFSSITFELQFVGSLGALGGNLEAAVYTGLGGGGGTGLIATSNLLPATTLLDGTFSPITFTFSSPVSLTGGTTYYIIVQDGGGLTLGSGGVIQFLITSSVNPDIDNYELDGVLAGGSPGSATTNFSLTYTPASEPVLTFTQNFFLELPGLNYSDNTIPTSQSPISFPAVDMAAYVTPNLSPGGPSLTVSVSSLPSVPRTAVIIARTDANFDVIVGDSTRLKLGDSTQLYYTQNEIPVVQYLDPILTSLPSGTSYTVDGASAVNGDLILFTNLASGNNEIYQISGVGTSIVFTAQFLYKYKQAPPDGQKVVVTKGVSFAGQTAIYNAASTSFKVNDTIRLFNGVSANFWELSSIKNLGLPDNATTQVFSVTALGSENWVIGVSISRGTNKDTGLLFLTQNGTTAQVSGPSSYIGTFGVSFSAAISGPNLILSATTTSTGTSANLKYWSARWSDASTGGPTGVPSYTPGASASAFALADGSATPFNCSNPTVSGGVTHLVLSFTYLTGQNPGSTVGDLSVYYNGQRIPRFIDTAHTPTSGGDIYYNEVFTNEIAFTQDLSGTSFGIEVLREV